MKIPVLRLRRIRSPKAIKILSLATIIKAPELLLWGFLCLSWFL